MPDTFRQARHDGQLDNPAAGYRAACDRLEAASRRCQRARREAERIVRDADAEWEAADADLNRYETAPGLPLPELRPWPAASAGTTRRAP